MARKLHLDMRELVGCLIWAEEGRRSGSTASRAAAEGELVGEGFPVTDWQRGGAGELC